MVIKTLDTNLLQMWTANKMIPRQGFFIKFSGQKYRGIINNAHIGLQYALVSFQDENGNWNNEEMCSIEDLHLWTEGKKQLNVVNPCHVMFQSWRGAKCLTCPYVGQI